MATNSVTLVKTKHLLASLAICCAAAALVGCASAGRQMSESSLDDKMLERDEALSPTGRSQPVILDERAFRKPSLDTNAAVALDELQYFSTNAVTKESLGTLDENDAGQINAREFSTPVPKHSEIYPFFGVAEQIYNKHFSWEQQEFEPPGWPLFSIRF